MAFPSPRDASGVAECGVAEYGVAECHLLCMDHCGCGEPRLTILLRKLPDRLALYVADFGPLRAVPSRCGDAFGAPARLIRGFACLPKPPTAQGGPHFKHNDSAFVAQQSPRCRPPPQCTANAFAIIVSGQPYA